MPGMNGQSYLGSRIAARHSSLKKVIACGRFHLSTNAPSPLKCSCGMLYDYVDDKLTQIHSYALGLVWLGASLQTINTLNSVFDSI